MEPDEGDIVVSHFFKSSQISECVSSGELETVTMRTTINGHPESSNLSVQIHQNNNIESSSTEDMMLYELAAAIETQDNTVSESRDGGPERASTSHLHSDHIQSSSTEDLMMYELAAATEARDNIVFRTQVGGGRKRTAPDDEYLNQPSTSNINQPSTSNLDQPSTSNVDSKTCNVCKKMVSSRYFSNHLKSKTHKNNLLHQTHALSNVTVLDTAFGCRIITYKVTSPTTDTSIVQTPETFFISIKDTLLTLIDHTLKDLTVAKINFIIHAKFVQETKNIFNTFDFQMPNYTLALGDDLEPFFKNLSETIKCKMSEFERKGSGWSLLSIEDLEMNVNKFDPLRGSSYVPLPRDIQLKKAVINVKNNDYECLRWALLSAIYPTSTHSDRTSSYEVHKNALRFDNVPFPVKLKDISKVEHLNDISINVFGLEFDRDAQRHMIVGPLYFTKKRKQRHINLLYIANDSNSGGHYCYIKNLSRLVSNQINRRNGAMFICDGCLVHFATLTDLKNHQLHDCTHTVTILPDPEKMKMKKNWFNLESQSNKVIFDNYLSKFKIPFVIYADFEAFLKPLRTDLPDSDDSWTVNYQKHEVYSYGYYIKCSYDDSLSCYRTYTGIDCANHFFESLVRDATKMNKINSFQKRPISLDDEQIETVGQISVCHICKNTIDNNDRTEDYDWNTGHFRGIAHTICSSKFSAPKFIPIFLHNLSNYDAHFIVHAINTVEGEINVIPLNKEKYISFSKKLTLNGKLVELRFLDSFKFMSSSLDSLAKNLQPHQLKELRKDKPLQADFDKLTRKGIFPYEFVTGYKALESKSLPDKKHFYSSLTESNISDEDYAHAVDIWNHFQCETLMDYSNLYLRTDVLLLADVYENFRDVCLQTYDIDPAHYYTAPGLSWDAMLKHTGVKLELLTDFDKLALVKSGIRGGVSQCCNRHGKANNKYLSDYNPNERDSYLAYYDANNLYGWAMSQYLPYGGFEWVDPNTDFNVPNTSDIGYILEVDLDYPEELHDDHSDLPMCPENIYVGGCKQLRLVPNLNNKTKYIIHYTNLKQCLEMGLILKKVHRILQFKQGPWLKQYVDLNTKLRTLASNEFQKDFYKLMINACYGKSMENVENRVSVLLLNRWENRGKSMGAQSYIARPEFHSLSIFSENLVAVQLKTTKVFYNKPIYLGFCILDISKTLMFDFHYNYIKPKFHQNVKLLYTDTDSFVYQFFTDDLYRDIKKDIATRFDTSNYTADNVFGFPLINKKKLGFFKDEVNGKLIREFVGLRSKLYAMDVDVVGDANKIIAKAKGVNKHVTKRLKLSDYKSCLYEKKKIFCEMSRFRSIKHVIFTQKLKKVSLSYNDTKRYLIPESTDTLAWGHFRIPENDQ